MSTGSNVPVVDAMVPYSYGAAGGAGRDAVKPAGLVEPRRPSSVLMCAVFFLPVVIFSIFLSLESFNAHFENPSISKSLAVFGSVIVLVAALLAAQQARTDGCGPVAIWQGLLAASLLLAVVASISVGEGNFAGNMRPYYDITNLNEYPNVDPALFSGNQMMDAGKIDFAEGSKLETKYSMAFRNSDVYCVVPIVSGDNELASYDFWAVGMNCCTGDSNSFHCGEYANPEARSGLRLMQDDERAFYRLAVQQAEAAFNIEAKHPLFFYWMADTKAEINAYEDAGYKTFSMAILGFFALQLLIVAVGAALTSKY